MAGRARSDNPVSTTTITLNGESRELASGASLADLIAALDLPPQSVATAVNGEFVARDARAAHVLREGDAVFTFQPITGG
jgi:sulfur carrier protein